MKTLNLLILCGLLTLAIQGYTQTNENVKKDSLITLIINCSGDSLSIKIPSGQYATQKDDLGEGFIFLIGYVDGSSIGLLCSSKFQLNVKKTRGLFWRKEKIGNRTIIYQNVTADRVDIFNEAFDLFNTK